MLTNVAHHLPFPEAVGAQGFQFFHCFCLLVNFWYLLEMVLEMKSMIS